MKSYIPESLMIVAALILIVGITHANSKRLMEIRAISAGVGEYRLVSPNSQKVEFRWITNATTVKTNQ